MKKTTPKNCRKFLPPPGGRFDLGFEKLEKVFFADYYRRNEKSAAGENFRNRDRFYTKNSTKMQKMANIKFTPPVGGTENVFNLGIPPGRGGLQKVPPHWGIYPLLIYMENVMGIVP